MNILIKFIVALVAFEHIYFMILEMFYWDKPKGLKAFGLKLEDAKISKTLAKNQGLYNGFLAAGLIWGLINKSNFEQIALFFLICVTIAGIYGSYTTKKIKLFLVQAIPAIIGIILILLKN
jgi:putative membrane protein